MTATTAPTRSRVADTPRPDRAVRLAGTGTLVRFMLRRDRVKLPAWVGGLGLFVVYIGSALPQLAPTEQDLQAVSPMLTQPVGRMFSGPAYGMDAVTYERFFAAGYVPYLVILAALMNIMLVTRHTRAEEQGGRAELVRAGVVGRQAPLTAALLVALVTDAAATLVVAGLASAFGFAATGSLLVGVSVGVTGLAFAGVTAVTVQLTEYSRAAAGTAGLVLGVAFVLRALGDMIAIGGSALSWTSPLGWAAQTAPYVEDRWWPLLPSLALAAGGVAVAYALQSRRDLGAGLVATRRGRTSAAAYLGSPLGLAARLQRGPVIAWGLAVLVFGVVDGAFTQLMVDGADDMPDLMGQMFGMESLLDGYVAFLAVFSGYLTAAYVVFAIQALRAEEAAGRAEAVLATPTSRTAWAGSHLAVVAVAAAVILLVSGVGTGLAAAAVTGDSALVGEATAAHLNLLPAVLVLVGLGALLFGWAPSLLALVGWSVVGLMVFVGNFAALLDLPDWVRDLSPLSHPAQIPAEAFRVGPLVWLLAVTLVGVLLGLAGLARREVAAR